MASRSSDGRRYYFSRHETCFYDPESPIITPESEPISETGSLETRSSSGQSVSRGISPPTSKSRAFPAGVRGGAGGAVGRDGRGAVLWRRRAAISLSGQIPVPQGR